MSNIIEQLNALHENDEYQRIVDIITGLEKDELNPEIIGHLARAYNNIGGFDNLHKAVDILLALEGEIDEFKRLYRLGYSYVFLDKDKEAIETLNKALELMPEDEDCKELIEISEEKLRLPIFQIPFAKRVEEEWALFSEYEEALREEMQEGHPSEELLEAISDIFRFEGILVELSMGTKPELIFTAEGNPHMFPLVTYIVSKTPNEISKNWNIHAGRYATDSSGFDFTMNEDTIKADEVQVWLTNQDNIDSIGIELYFDNIKIENDEDLAKANWYASILLDHYLGEVINMYAVRTWNAIKEPKDSEPLKLNQLLAKFEELGIDTNSQNYIDSLQTYTYKHEPAEESKVTRDDVFAGNTAFPHLMEELAEGEENNADEWYENGVAPCFLVFPIAPFIEDNKLNGIGEFTEKLEKALCGDNAIFFGNAVGDYLYVDFLTWDFKAFIQNAMEVIEADDSIEFAVIDFFTQSANPVIIKSNDDEDDDDSEDDE